MTSTLTEALGHAEARPVWADIDLDAITHNVALIRSHAGRPVKLLIPVKAARTDTAWSRSAGTSNGWASMVWRRRTWNASRLRPASAAILLYGAQLPAGNSYLLEHGLTPTIYDHLGLRAVAAAAPRANRSQST